ncbi:putative toxin-antitoxin system toxin component, PIN family [Spirosoma rhododendri]|uniref:Putative toxin-antitoxin system toxin component, PIN family n=1 Tax=Spirosoma rhododendri TaxID=2728024 RepID=A0A7L5DJH8_9BACT|nr:putative toxin-antitoxin system toxin component, PIN family [Spirosoma rhododendri]QJD78546.1 putative toxin-antitoxin system toxin component, PIN family [Spirosoma rhododendri]
MRVVIDTNALLVSIPKVSMSRWLFDAVLDGTLEMVVSTEILQEYEEIIGSFWGSARLAENIINTLVNLQNLIRAEPHYFWYLIENDPDDNKFVDCAIAGNADYIITEDRHFNALATINFPKVRAVTRQQFAVLFNEKQ